MRVGEIVAAQIGRDKIFCEVGRRDADEAPLDIRPHQFRRIEPAILRNDADGLGAGEFRAAHRQFGTRQRLCVNLPGRGGGGSSSRSLPFGNRRLPLPISEIADRRERNDEAADDDDARRGPFARQRTLLDVVFGRGNGLVLFGEPPNVISSSGC